MMELENTQPINLDPAADVVHGQAGDINELLDDFREANLYVAGLYINGVQGYRIKRALEDIDELGLKLIVTRKAEIDPPVIDHSRHQSTRHRIFRRLVNSVS